MATRCQKIISVASGEEIVKTVCNSNNRINRLHFNDPGGKYSIDVSCCQKCSDLLYNSLSWSQRMWQADTHLDYESKQKELREIRWNHCRKCNHPLDCHCKVCKNEYEEIWSLVFFHSTGRFRAAFHLHRKCCREVMASVGEDFLDIGSGPGKQTIFENFKEYEFEEPKPLGSSDSNQRIQRPVFKICRFPGCEAQVEVEKWYEHKNFHSRYDSTDKVQEQFLGKHIKKEEVMVCEKHSKRAVRGTQGFMVCPVSGCNETLKPKMLPVKIEFDPLMCVYHQSELKYDSAQSKLKCGVEGCDMSYCMRKSYLIAELRQGYITGRDGVKVPFDPEHRAVTLDGKTVILKII